MNPIALFAQMFGRSVPPILVAEFTFYFSYRMYFFGNVKDALIYAARKTLLPI